MRRGNNGLLVILAVLLLAGTAALGYFYFQSGDTSVVNGTALPPTPRPDQEVVLAAIDVRAGTVFSSTEMFKKGTVGGDEYAANPKAYFTTIDELKGQKAIEDLSGGKVIKHTQIGEAGLSDLIPLPTPGQEAVHAFPVQVSALTGVADQIQPGDFVDVMASFNQKVVTYRFSKLDNANGAQATQGPNEEFITENTEEGNTKVLLQDVQVLKIIRPAPPAPDATVTPAPEAPPADQNAGGGQGGQPPAGAGEQAAINPAGSTLSTGNWVLIVAVTNQEAEVLRFVLDRGIGLSTLLRATGDHTTQRTVGATMRILVDNYGMPIASTLPGVQHEMPIAIPNIPTLPDVPEERFAPKLPTPTAEAPKAGAR